jgi:hypothetical protein
MLKRYKTSNPESTKSPPNFGFDLFRRHFARIRPSTMRDKPQTIGVQADFNR